MLGRIPPLSDAAFQPGVDFAFQPTHCSRSDGYTRREVRIGVDCRAFAPGSLLDLREAQDGLQPLIPGHVTFAVRLFP